MISGLHEDMGFLIQVSLTHVTDQEMMLPTFQPCFRPPIVEKILAVCWLFLNSWELSVEMFYSMRLLGNVWYVFLPVVENHLCDISNLCNVKHCVIFFVISEGALPSFMLSYTYFWALTLVPSCGFLQKRDFEAPTVVLWNTGAQYREEIPYPMQELGSMNPTAKNHGMFTPMMACCLNFLGVIL